MPDSRRTKSPKFLAGVHHNLLHTFEEINAHTCWEDANEAYNKEFSGSPIPNNETGVFNPKEYGKDVFGYGDE